METGRRGLDTSSVVAEKQERQLGRRGTPARGPPVRRPPARGAGLLKGPHTDSLTRRRPPWLWCRDGDVRGAGGVWHEDWGAGVRLGGEGRRAGPASLSEVLLLGGRHLSCVGATPSCRVGT